MLTRRTLLKWGGTAAAALLVPHAYRHGRSFAADFSDSFFGYQPFTQPLFIPETLKRLEGANRLNPAPGAYPRPWKPLGIGSGPSTPRRNFNDVAHGIAPEFGLCGDWNRKKSGFSGSANTHEHEFGLFIEETTHRFVPYGPDVPILSYRDATMPVGSGNTPGPTIVAEYLEPVVLRNYNRLSKYLVSARHDIETSMHLHGSHGTAHGDGFPDFYCLADEARDYFYPNIAPRKTDRATQCAPACSGEYDETWIPTTMWYHDHAMDITGFTVSHGLAGFYLVFDDRQRALAERGVLPEIGARDTYDNPLDIALALTDQRFNADGTVFYDFFDHDGRLGNVFTVNGVVQPKIKLERRKYRLRILNASNARIYELRLSTRQPMSIIGTDTWLLPYSINAQTLQLAQGQRHDVIIDFRCAPDEVYLENILLQTSGRGADAIDPSRPTRLLKFEFDDLNYPCYPEAALPDRAPIRGIAGVHADGQFELHRRDEVVATRHFRFDRSNGGWTMNNRLFNPRRADAEPELGYGTEAWTFENSSGGWWHPIHTHLEGFQIQTINGRLPRPERRFNSDLVALEGNFVAEVLLKMRTFTGPFAFHCHAVEHEDMRMMAVIDPTPGPHGCGDAKDPQPRLDGETRINPYVSGVMPDCKELEEDHRIFFEKVGDHDILEGRGVGGDHCTFDMNGDGNRS